MQVGVYHIDFAIIDKMIAIEVDGDQHYLDNRVVKSDKNKDKYLKNKGWDIIRIKWSDYQKMKKKEREDYIIELINYIKDIIFIKPTIKYTKKEHYCITCGKNKVYSEGNECVKCSHIKQRKAKNRPEKDKLIKMIKESSLEAVGRKYGVTGNAVKKWLK